MLRLVRRLVALCLLAGLLAAAGCGGSPARLSKASYLAKSEAVCSKLEADGHALPDPASPRDLPAYLTASTALTVTAKAKLDALAARYSDPAYVHRIFLDPLAAQITALRRIMPRVIAESAKGSTAALDGLALPQADLEAMGVYGFHECRKVVGSR